VTDRPLVAFDRAAFQHAMIDAGVKSVSELAALAKIARPLMWNYAHGMLPPDDHRAEIAKHLRVAVGVLWVEVKR
jgi:hypothetical protein